MPYRNIHRVYRGFASPRCIALSHTALPNENRGLSCAFATISVALPNEIVTFIAAHTMYDIAE